MYNEAMNNLRINCLGTGDAFGSGGRNQSGYRLENSIEGPDGALLLDCGATALVALTNYKFQIDAIETIFLSHLHGDHIGGLPYFFLYSVFIAQRKRPLKIIGPPGVERGVRAFFRAAYPDQTDLKFGYALNFIEAQPNEEIQCNGFQIMPFLVPHQENALSFGCEIKSGGRKLVYSGDSGWTEDLVVHAQNADLFLCECNYFTTRLGIHLDYPRIMENIDRFGAKRILLTHLGLEVLQHQQDVQLELAYDGMEALL
jgi:ribonuclease BN (tRNA processing enzyme)